MFVEGVTLQEGLASVRSLPSADLNMTSAKAASVDWTTGKCVNPVRNQGQCGSCWAFSAVSAAESAHCIVTRELLDLSEQQVTSCSTNGGSVGCRGGWPFAAITYTTQGMCLEKDYPYTSGKTSQTGTCTNTCTKKKLKIGAAYQVAGEAALDTILNTQPVSVLVEAGNSAWMNYRSGVITQCPGSPSDHAVIAVGYDGTTYKIRNSWGTSWGEAGYIRLKRGVKGLGMCNVAEVVSFPQISKPNPKPTVHPGCATCSECYFASARKCLNYDKDDCAYYNKNYGLFWCGK
ncbi:hypothetical protein H310_02806 [Aphanomyces invadans]|nr:hypothetical protein H310_02806 [Aphanomyces invadans]ETW06588.1 hypothetical protein H310_02806 [Aphanomyces invadans]|eukprot:XP_008864663.1 hypothetical protein H310_02806 [Aphanomyces invadans]